MKIPIATLMSVYHGDEPAALDVAIRSIKNQNLPENIESRIYLAIDGPISSSLNDVIVKHASGLFFIHRIKQNGGLAAALNLLISNLSDEKFIFRMDADDFSYKDRFQVQLDYLESHPEVDILGTDIIEVNSINGSRRRINFCRGPEAANKKLCQGVPVAHPTVCFRRDVLDSVGGYPLSGTNEDIALWFRCAKAGFKFDNVRQPLLDFTIGPNFFKRRNFRKAYNEMSCYFSGIWSMDGVTWKFIFPVLRFSLRLSPLWVSKIFYASPLRRFSSK